MNHLSYSKVNTYKECPRKYKLYYIDKFRPIMIKSALIFGSAIDKAIENSLLYNRDTFDWDFRFQKINDEETYIPTSLKVSYSNADYDIDLLKQEDLQKLKDEFKIEEIKAELDKSFQEKKEFGFNSLHETRQKLINYASWLSLYRKGKLIMEAFQKDIKPHITEVLGTQLEIRLVNNLGDTITGRPDLVGKWKDFQKPIIFDFKTSSKPYEKDSVKTSPQLTTYMHELSDKFEDTRMGGYIVFNKKVNKTKHLTCLSCGHKDTGQSKKCTAKIDGKRCNGDWETVIVAKCETQVIIDEIPTETEDTVIQEYDDINNRIKEEDFSCNPESCVGKYGKCDFYDLCHSQSTEGLIQLKKK